MQRGGRIRTAKKRAGESTHVLESIEGGTSHDTETKRARHTHVLESTREGQVRTAKKVSEQRFTYYLESRGRDKSGK